MKEFRKEFNLTQEEAAQILGYSNNRVVRAVELDERNMSAPVLKVMQYYRKGEKDG